jgi:enterobactin synthetase component D
MFFHRQKPNIFTSSVAYCSVETERETLLMSSFDCITADSMRRFSPKRRLDFIAGRYCALKALEMLGMKNCPEIGVRSNGSPAWPQGWIGSITHTDGFASAAVARADALHSLGIDTEHIMSHDTATDIVCLSLLPAERQRWEQRLHPGLSFAAYVTLVFSAKESVYKCLNPLFGVFLEFHDVEIRIATTQTGRFDIKLRNDITETMTAGRFLQGKFAIAPPYIHTAVELVQGFTPYTVTPQGVYFFEKNIPESEVSYDIR